MRVSLRAAPAAGYRRSITTLVVGSGWAGFQVLRKLKLKPDDKLVCVSKHNHFLFTPLLTSTTVGTLEFRNISEPTKFARRDLTFYHGNAVSVDPEKQTVQCESALTSARTDEDGAERYRPSFELPYDRLVIAAGAQAATFGIPGVEEYTYPLRQLADARAIRQRLINVFERASSPFSSEEEKKRLLSFVIVGGGPTSTEFAAELHDFLEQDVASRLYPDLQRYCSVTLVEASQRLLGGFDEALSEYTMRLFRTRQVRLLLQHTVKEVHAHHLELDDGSRLPHGLCVWSTGNQMIPFVQRLPFAHHDRSGRLLVDDHLHPLPADPSAVSADALSRIYAAGDCAQLVSSGLPPTAQVASQQGVWLARHLDGRTRAPFRYTNLGMLAYVGGARALVDLPIFKTSGFAGWLLWVSAYLTNMVSWRNKLLIPANWLKTRVFGRDTISFPDGKSWKQ